MVTIKDILSEFAIVLLWFFSTVIAIALFNLSFLALPFFLAFVISKIYIKRRKKILDFVKNDFQKLGYQLKYERPVTFREFFINRKTQIKPVFFANDIPLKRYTYMRDFKRIFIAEFEDNKIYELNTFIIHKWNGENKIKIIDIKRFRN